jgi:GR25 family glycosyltransferase involved in LPS biosynthesis
MSSDSHSNVVENLNDALNYLCGKDSWVGYTVHLDRAVERKIQFQQWADYCELSFNWWKATDKLNLTEDDYKLCDVYVNGTAKCAGATACRLSHYRLAKYLLSKPEYTDKKYFLIMEDDISFIGNEEDRQLKKNEFINFCKEVKDKKYRWDHIWFFSVSSGMKRQIPISKNVCIFAQTHSTVMMLFERSQLELLVQLSEIDDPQLKSLPIDWLADIIRLNKKGVCLGPIKNVVDHIDNGVSFVWN